MPLRVVFMGTAELACASLKALVDSPEFEVAAVVTQPDRPKGRDLKLQPSPVKQVALAANLPVLQPERARNPEFIAQLAALQLDYLVVAAYGQILPESMLNAPRYGGVNVHTSLLPKYRGAAPIQWAILDDQPETGVTIMRMAAGLDTGDILSTVKTPIQPDDTAATLHDRLSILGAELLVPTLIEFASGKITAVPQDETKSSYARKITKEDGRLNWALPARTLWNRVRAFTPWPGAFTHLAVNNNKKLLKVFRVGLEPLLHGKAGEVIEAGKQGIVIACGEGAVRILELQPEGGRRMDVAQFLAGNPIAPGTLFG